MGVALAEQVIEVRVEQEDRLIATVSHGTLDFMYRHGLARERRLRNHRGNLGLVADEERDLFEGMRLAERLSTVDKNIRGTSRRNERLRAEIVRREADRRAPGERRAWRYPFRTGGERWNEETLRVRDSVAGGG
jgi:hypothetical protein